MLQQLQTMVKDRFLQQKPILHQIGVYNNSKKNGIFTNNKNLIPLLMRLTTNLEKNNNLNHNNEHHV